MLSEVYTDEELRKEIYSLRRELRMDIGEVRDISRTSSTIPTYAVERMRALEKSMREKSVRSMNSRELRNTYRDLKYIRDLKSSSAEGALEVSDTLEALKDAMEGLSAETRTKIWDIYGKVLQHNADLRNFKYEIWNVMEDVAMGSSTISGAIEAIIDEHEMYAKGEGDYEYADDRTALFIQKLSNLLR